MLDCHELVTSPAAIGPETTCCLQAFSVLRMKRPVRTTSARLAWRRRHSWNHARKRERGYHASVQVGATGVADRDGARAATTRGPPPDHPPIWGTRGGHSCQRARTASRARAKLRRLTARHAESFRVSFPRKKARICRHFSCRRRDSNPRHADYDSARRVRQKQESPANRRFGKSAKIPRNTPFRGTLARTRGKSGVIFGAASEGVLGRAQARRSEVQRAGETRVRTYRGLVPRESMRPTL